MSVDKICEAYLTNSPTLPLNYQLLTCCLNHSQSDLNIYVSESDLGNHCSCCDISKDFHPSPSYLYVSFCIFCLPDGVKSDTLDVLAPTLLLTHRPPAFHMLISSLPFLKLQFLPFFHLLWNPECLWCFTDIKTSNKTENNNSLIRNLDRAFTSCF